MKSRYGATAFAALTFVVHATFAWLYPMLRDDWTALLWKAEHADYHPGGWALSFLGSHFTLGELFTYVLAVAPLLHVVLTPIVFLLMIWGILCASQRRLVRFDTWSDVGLLVAASTLWWVAQPHGGIAVSERDMVALYLYGTTIGVWLYAAYVCGWEIRGRRTILVTVAAFLVGLASRQIAVVGTVWSMWFVLGKPRHERLRWHWAVAIALLVGTIVGYLDTPRFTIPRSDFDQNANFVFQSLRENGELVTLMMVFAFAKLLLDRRANVASVDELPDTAPAFRCLWIAVGVEIISIWGPRFTESSLLPASVLLAIGAVPFITWLARTPLVKKALFVVLPMILVATWINGLLMLTHIHGIYADRMDAIAAAPRDSIAQVPPYDMFSTDWFTGEDWSSTSLRERVAIDIFHLEDIEYTAPFGALERNPRLAVEMHLEGRPAEASKQVPVPQRWASNISVARAQFERFVRSLHRAGYTDFSATLSVKLENPRANGRPLLLARVDKGTLVSPRVSRGNPNVDGTIKFKIRNLPSAYGERFLITAGVVTDLPATQSAFELQPQTIDRHTLITCSTVDCLVLDSFIPKATAPQ
ncbi:MAG TPA: DUF6056 family protein [Kofleriaceae bacterium]